jgi:hypothetical protein
VLARSGACDKMIEALEQAVELWVDLLDDLS